MFLDVIKSFHLVGKSPKVTKADLGEVHDTSSPAFKIVHKLVSGFKLIRAYTSDEHRSTSPLEVTTP